MLGNQGGQKGLGRAGGKSQRKVERSEGSTDLRGQKEGQTLRKNQIKIDNPVMEAQRKIGGKEQETKVARITAQRMSGWNLSTYDMSLAQQ